MKSSKISTQTVVPSAEQFVNLSTASVYHRFRFDDGFSSFSCLLMVHACLKTNVSHRRLYDFWPVENLSFYFIAFECWVVFLVVERFERGLMIKVQDQYSNDLLGRVKKKNLKILRQIQFKISLIAIIWSRRRSFISIILYLVFDEPGLALWAEHR